MPIYIPRYSIYSAAEVTGFLSFPLLLIWPFSSLSPSIIQMTEWYSDFKELKWMNVAKNISLLSPCGIAKAALLACFTHPSRWDVDWRQMTVFFISSLAAATPSLRQRGSATFGEDGRRCSLKVCGCWENSGWGDAEVDVCSGGGIIFLLISFHK